MNKLFFAVSTIVFISTGCSGMGNRHMSSGENMMGSMMKQMDANGDEMLSKEEFMKGHESMFDRMKGSNGMISLKDMPMKGMGMMHHGSSMGQGNQMSSGK